MEGALHLEVDESALPSIMPPRRVPLALKKRLKEELARIEKASVIKKEEEPTDWVSSFVVTEKPNGKLRVYIDPQHLNKALKRSHYPLPIIEDILPGLADVILESKPQRWILTDTARPEIQQANNVPDPLGPV